MSDGDVPRRNAFAGIVRSGALSVLLHPLWSATSVACLAAILAPLLVAIGLARGAGDAAAASLAEGADVTVTATRFGRPAPLPESAATLVAAIPGVRSVEPRVVGAVRLGAEGEPVVLVGVPAARLDPALAPVTCAEGRLPRPGPVPEVALGSVLAARLGLRAGDAIPPFSRSRTGGRVTTVAGVFRSDLPSWEARVLLTTIETAQQVFDEPGTVTALLVRCDPEYAAAVRGAILRLPTLGPADGPPVVPRAVLRDDLAARFARASVLREGGFAGIHALAVALGMPLLLVSTGLGLSERRRETGLLRALGWRTDEVVLRSLAESATLAVLGWSLAVLAAWVWVRGFGAAGIAPLFVPDAAAGAGAVPFRLAPEAVAASAAAAAALVSAGTLLTAWRSSSAAPAEAMR